ncbi:MAG: T9SS type A sorting domain-containing protein [Bacteroidales bacterium]|nr:T9SS type A sorting domain-containing protein [Bacteroidales bacterium]
MKTTRHFFLILIALLSCRVAMAQDYFLEQVYSDDNVDQIRFYYNADNLLESYRSTSYSTGDRDDFIDSLQYDERGNVIRVDCYQYYNDEWIYPSYITYTYDENNHRLTRTNYNDWGSGFELQGVYTYFYDGDLLTNYEMTLVGTLIMRGTYNYDANGRCTQCLEEYNDVWGGGGWSNSSLVTYTYDGAGNCTNTTNFYWDNGWMPDSEIVRTYDANGNCLIRERHSSGLVVDRVSYTYDESCGIDHVLMPYHPEPLYTWDTFANRPLGYAWETMNDNNQLIYVCDYLFKYGAFESVPQNEIPVADLMVVYPNPATNEMTLSLEGLRQFEIIDMNGQTVMQGQTQGKRHTVDVSGLSSGCYVVKAYNGESWSFSKIVIK